MSFPGAWKGKFIIKWDLEPWALTPCLNILGCCFAEILQELICCLDTVWSCWAWLQWALCGTPSPFPNYLQTSGTSNSLGSCFCPWAEAECSASGCSICVGDICLVWVRNCSALHCPGSSWKCWLRFCSLRTLTLAVQGVVCHCNPSQKAVECFQKQGPGGGRDSIWLLGCPGECERLNIFFFLL